MSQHKKSAVLSSEARQARANYLREWRKKNADKRKEYDRRYWEKKAAQAAGEAG